MRDPLVIAALFGMIAAAALAVAALARRARERSENARLRAEVRRYQLQLAALLLAPQRDDAGRTRPNDAASNVLPFPVRHGR